MTQEIGKSYAGLTIIRGKRHCKIVDEANEVVFRTTNLRDAEHYLEMIEENDRLQRLLDARGIAPHRIYMMAIDESQRGQPLDIDQTPVTEVVIVAKADNETVVVRHLEDGREEIVDLDEIEPISGGSYLQGPDVTDETVHVVMRYDREREQASVAAFRSEDEIDPLIVEWLGEEAPGSEYASTLVQSEGDLLIYRVEVSVEG